MPGRHETSRTASSVLKTTTWGGLIACTAALLLAGILGYSPWNHAGDLGQTSVPLAAQSIPLTGLAAPAAHADSSLNVSVGRALPLTGKSTLAETATTEVSVSTAAPRENNADRSNQPVPRHSDAPSNDSNTTSTASTTDDPVCSGRKNCPGPEGCKS